MIVLVYVDDCIFFAPKKQDILDMLNKWRDSGLKMEPEQDIAGFLGVLINKDEEKGTLQMVQNGLIQQSIEAMGLSSSKIKQTPAKKIPLVADKSGEPCNEAFNFLSVVRMLSYLAGHTCPDIEFAVHQCGRYSHCPRAIHETALKQVGRYLVGTKDKGLIFTPDDALTMECCVDSDFARLWPHEDPHDPISTRSCTGYVLKFASAPVLWKSKLQTENVLRMMESEYVALSTALRDFIPMKELILELTKAVGLESEQLDLIKSTVWEDNEGCCKLANMEMPRMTPMSKHYAVKYHWFCTHLEPNGIVIERVSLEDNIADLLTKGLLGEKIRTLRELLCGW